MYNIIVQLYNVGFPEKLNKKSYLFFSNILFLSYTCYYELGA